MMAAFYGFMIALMLVMRLAPHTPFGTWLNRSLIKEPLERLAALERHHLIFLGILLVMSLGIGEAIAVYGSLEWALVSMFDLSVYLDAVAVTVALGAAARMRGALQVVRARLGRRTGPRRAARQRRARSTARKPARKTANDDDHPAFSLAA